MVRGGLDGGLEIRERAADIAPCCTPVLNSCISKVLEKTKTKISPFQLTVDGLARAASKVWHTKQPSSQTQIAMPARQAHQTVHALIVTSNGSARCSQCCAGVSELAAQAPQSMMHGYWLGSRPWSCRALGLQEASFGVNRDRAYEENADDSISRMLTWTQSTKGAYR